MRVCRYLFVLVILDTLVICDEPSFLPRLMWSSLFAELSCDDIYGASFSLPVFYLHEMLRSAFHGKTYAPKGTKSPTNQPKTQALPFSQLKCHLHFPCRKCVRKSRAIFCFGSESLLCQLIQKQFWKGEAHHPSFSYDVFHQWEHQDSLGRATKSGLDLVSYFWKFPTFRVSILCSGELFCYSFRFWSSYKPSSNLRTSSVTVSRTT